MYNLRTPMLIMGLIATKFHTLCLHICIIFWHDSQPVPNHKWKTQNQAGPNGSYVYKNIHAFENFEFSICGVNRHRNCHFHALIATLEAGFSRRHQHDWVWGIFKWNILKWLISTNGYELTSCVRQGQSDDGFLAHRIRELYPCLYKYFPPDLGTTFAPGTWFPVNLLIKVVQFDHSPVGKLCSLTHIQHPMRFFPPCRSR